MPDFETKRAMGLMVAGSVSGGEGDDFVDEGGGGVIDVSCDATDDGVPAEAGAGGGGRTAVAAAAAVGAGGELSCGGGQHHPKQEHTGAAYSCCGYHSSTTRSQATPR